MRLTDLFQNNHIMAEKSDSLSGNLRPAALTGDTASTIVAGQVIEGEIVSRQGKEVQLKLLNNLLLNATMDEEVTIAQGKSVFFQVKAGGTQLVLAPLFTNMATEEPVMKALDAANLPVNETTTRMTLEMMKAGLPIDRNTLQNLYHETKAFQDADVLDIVDLHRLGLSVNESSVEQMGAYKNFTHQLTQGMNRVVDELQNVCNRLLAEGEYESAGQLLKGVFHAALAGEENPAQSDPILQNAVLNENVQPEKVEVTGQTTQVSSDKVPENLTPEEALIVTDGDFETEPENVGPKLQEPLNSESLKKLYHELMDKESFSDTGVVYKLLQDKSLLNVVFKQLNENFSLTPEQLKKDKGVEEVYERLNSQLKVLSNALEEAQKTDTQAFRAVKNMNQNLDFLHQMNQVYQYVQLPIQFGQDKAHGDLYVYSGKKSLERDDGKITALLHLDMEHLGPLDVYVTLEQGKVGTDFYVQDDEILSFLEDHMELLTARLQEKGYQIDVNTKVRQPENGENENTERLGALKPLLKKKDKGQLLQRMSFDMRA